MVLAAVVGPDANCGDIGPVYACDELVEFAWAFLGRLYWEGP